MGVQASLGFQEAKVVGTSIVARGSFDMICVVERTTVAEGPPEAGAPVEVGGLRAMLAFGSEVVLGAAVGLLA